MSLIPEEQLQSQEIAAEDAANDDFFPMLKSLDDIFYDIAEERIRQEAKWGQQNHSPMEWCPILTKEVGQVNKAARDTHFKNKGADTDYSNYEKELVHVAAVAVSMLQSLERQRKSEATEANLDKIFKHSPKKVPITSFRAGLICELISKASGKEQWEWVIDHKHSDITIIIDNDATILRFNGTKDENGNEYTFHLKDFIGNDQGVYNLLESLGIDHEVA